MLRLKVTMYAFDIIKGILCGTYRVVMHNKITVSTLLIMTQTVSYSVLLCLSFLY